MKQRLTQETREQAEEESEVSAAQAQAAVQRTDKTLSFDSAEAMLRHDAAGTDVPARVKDRVLQSIAGEITENTSTPWWKRWMPF